MMKPLIDPYLLINDTSSESEEELLLSPPSSSSSSPTTSSSLQNTDDSETNLRLHRCVASWKTPSISCLAVQATLLYAAAVNQINVYDLATFAHLDLFCCKDSSSGSVKSIAFHSDGDYVFSAHQDCKIRVWRRNGTVHRLVSSLPTVKDRLIRSVLPKNYVRVRRHKKELWIKHNDAISGLVVRQGLVYSVSWDKSFKTWSASTGQCLESVRAHDDAVNAIAVGGDGTVFTASADGRISVWERDCKRRHRLTETLIEHKSTVNALLLTEDEAVLLSASSDGLILVWARVEGGGPMAVMDALVGHGGPVLCLSSLGHVVASGSSDGTVRVWTRRHHMERSFGYGCAVVLEGHERPIKSLVAFSIVSGKVSVSSTGVGEDNDPNNDVISICSGSLDGEIKIWEVYV